MKKPKIVLFDLETLPIVTKHIENLPIYNSDRYGMTLKSDFNSVLCFGYKMLGEKQTYCVNSWDTAAGKKDINNDKDVLKVVQEVLSDADAVITHNGKNFDYKVLQTRLLINGMEPLPVIQHIDTKQLASRTLFMSSNRLDSLAKELNTARKRENHGWAMWSRLSLAKYQGVDAPTKKQIEKDKRIMEHYCKGDVIALEKLFLKLRPFAKNIPNYNLFKDESEREACPSCGGHRIQKKGFISTKTQRLQRYVCMDCGSSSSKTTKGVLK